MGARCDCTSSVKAWEKREGGEEGGEVGGRIEGRGGEEGGEGEK